MDGRPLVHTDHMLIDTMQVLVAKVVNGIKGAV